MRSSKPGAEADGLDAGFLFRSIGATRGLVLAVSGGPDSTALMILAARWPERPPTLVVAVDHALRPGSAAEAGLAAENAERLGLPHRVIRVPPRTGGGNLQDWARRARYRCLAAAAREAGFDTIVTAHHQDDQAETFLLRLARGSGVYGLAAMAVEGSAEGLRLVRPLLGVPRRRLAELVAASGLRSAADPSNADRRFDRVRMREMLPFLEQQGLTPARLAETAGRLSRAAAALDHYAGALLRERFQADAQAVVAGPASALADVPEEVSLRALALLLTAAGGADYTPRLDQLEALRRAILAADGRQRFKRTLHGVVITVSEGALEARREWGREGLPAMAAPAGATLVWDRRFRVHVPAHPGSLFVGPLGRSARRFRTLHSDKAALLTLPGLFAGDDLVAAPEGIQVADDGGAVASLRAECVVGERLRLSALAAPN